MIRERGESDLGESDLWGGLSSDWGESDLWGGLSHPRFGLGAKNYLEPGA